jgi:asparagine synthase (glutamine-hydrolysing)
MFSFAIWDEMRKELFCARDRFGIKPFYYTVVGRTLYFASEIKALVPFLPEIQTDLQGFKDYLTFQFCLAGKTLFEGVHELLPAHYMRVQDGNISFERYWEVFYNIDFDHTAKYFEERIRELVAESVDIHKRSDVPIGGYVSGGIDSTIVSSLASESAPEDYIGFTGKFTYGQGYDESEYARALADQKGFKLQEIDISVGDFTDNIERIIYHLDYPVAGPGVFPQFMVSKLASVSRKVVLGGQGGDEIFGGYTRYLIAYFEQCIKAAIDGTSKNGKFVVTYESIIPNLVSLRNYKPLLQDFWREGLFEASDSRYYRLINRAPSLGDEIRWEALGDYQPFDDFERIFNAGNVGNESYFDSMTHFDFKTLLPALLQVEDRMSMASGIESRVPFLDHPLVEFAATIPADVKFKDGAMKQSLKNAMAYSIPQSILDRKDKMGFPVPLNEWMKGEAREFVMDIFSSAAANGRPYVDNARVVAKLGKESKFSRNVWGLLSLELWQRQFHDRQSYFKQLANASQ